MARGADGKPGEMVNHQKTEGINPIPAHVVSGSWRLTLVGGLLLGFHLGPRLLVWEGAQESCRCQPPQKQASGRDVSADLHPEVTTSLVVNGWTKKLIEESERANLERSGSWEWEGRNQGN